MQSCALRILSLFQSTYEAHASRELFSIKLFIFWRQEGSDWKYSEEGQEDGSEKLLYVLPEIAT
jgi:hypothetical protein